MTAEDVKLAARGKPSPFEHGEFRCLLRPMTFAERGVVFDWRTTGKTGAELQAWLVVTFVCDESGKPLLQQSDLVDFDVLIVEAIAEAVMTRAGLTGDAGKA